MIFSDDSKLPILGSYTLAQKVSRASRVVTTSLGTSSPENQQQVHVGFLFCLKFKIKVSLRKQSWSLSLQPLFHSKKKKLQSKKCTSLLMAAVLIFRYSFFCWLWFLFFQKKVALFQLFLKIWKTNSTMWTIVQSQKMNEKNKNKGKSSKEKKSDICCCFWSLGEIVLFVLWRDLFFIEVNIFAGTFRQKNCSLMPQVSNFFTKSFDCDFFRGICEMNFSCETTSLWKGKIM